MYEFALKLYLMNKTAAYCCTLANNMHGMAGNVTG